MSGAPRADPHRPTGIRSPSPASGPSARSAAASNRRPAGPGVCRASAPSPPPTRRPERPPATTPRAANLRLQLGGQVRANGSAVSNTACTSVPNFAPIGRSAIGDGTSAPAGESSPGCRRPRRRARRLRLAAHRRRLGGANQAGVGCPSPRRVDRRWKCRASRSSRGGSGGGAGTVRHYRLLDGEAAQRLPLA